MENGKEIIKISTRFILLLKCLNFLTLLIYKLFAPFVLFYMLLGNGGVNSVQNESWVP